MSTLCEVETPVSEANPNNYFAFQDNPINRVDPTGVDDTATQPTTTQVAEVQIVEQEVNLPQMDALTGSPAVKGVTDAMHGGGGEINVVISRNADGTYGVSSVTDRLAIRVYVLSLQAYTDIGPFEPDEKRKQDLKDALNHEVTVNADPVAQAWTAQRKTFDKWAGGTTFTSIDEAKKAITAQINERWISGVANAVYKAIGNDRDLVKAAIVSQINAGKTPQPLPPMPTMEDVQNQCKGDISVDVNLPPITSQPSSQPG